MVSTLYRAQEILYGTRLISYGDIAYSPSILKMLENNNADISTVVDLNWREYWSARSDNPIEDLETMRIASTDLITELGARPRSLDEIQGQYIGLTYMSPRGSAVLKNTLLECNRTGLVNGKPFDNAYFTDLLQELINRGHEVAAVKIKLPWIEVDTVQDLVSESTISRLEQIDTEIRKILES